MKVMSLYTTTLHVILFSLTVTGYAQQHNIQVLPLGNKTYVHTSFKTLEQTPFPSNGLIVETGRGVILVDTPWDTAQTTQLLSWIRKAIGKPVTHCIVTHSHDDRVSGIPVLKRAHAKILAFNKTAKKLIADGYPSPDIILPEDSTFVIDDVSVQTYFPGEGHAPDNIVVWFPSERVLFGGCFVKSIQSFGLGNVADANLKQRPASIKRVKQKFSAAQFIIPGHQDWSKLNSLEHTEKLLLEN
jgi:metallo-beta-lactamase class B